MNQEIEPFIAQPVWQTLRVFGPDAATWLNGIVTCDVLSVQEGQGVWGSLLTKQGKITADLQIVGHSKELFVGLSGGDAAETLEILDGYLVMEDAEIEHSSRSWVVSSNQELPDEWSKSEVAHGVLPWGNCSVHAWALNEKLGTEVLSEKLRPPLLTPLQWSAWCTRQGIPLFGVDYKSSDNLHAASLERRTVDWSKGCYLGQEVVCMQDMRGKVRRRLMLLAFEEGANVTPLAEVVNNKQEVVGEVRSVAGEIALVSLRSPEFAPGTKLRVGSTPGVVQALV